MILPAAITSRRLVVGRRERYACAGTREPGVAVRDFARFRALVMLLACWPMMGHAGNLDTAIELANEGRFQEAHQQIAPLLEQHPDHFHARLLQGILRAREGRLDAAARLFEALQDTYPERSEPYNNLAAVYVAQGRLDDAYGALRAAIARQPELPAAHENLADLYIRLARRSNLRARDLAGTVEFDQDMSSDELAAGGPAAAAAPEQTRAMVVAADNDAASTPSRACVRATGFATAGDTADAAVWLEGQGATVKRRQDRIQVVRDHWVFYPPLASLTEAIAKSKEMRSNGVEDIAVIRHGDLANGISLGIYRSTDNMKRRVAALEGMGYPVQYETILETVTTYSLDAELAVLPAFLRADWASRFPAHPLETSGCDRDNSE